MEPNSSDDPSQIPGGIIKICSCLGRDARGAGASLWLNPGLVGIYNSVVMLTSCWLLIIITKIVIICQNHHHQHRAPLTDYDLRSSLWCRCRSEMGFYRVICLGGIFLASLTLRVWVLLLVLKDIPYRPTF